MSNYNCGCNPCGGGGNGWPNMKPCNCCGSASGGCWPNIGTGDETWTETITQPCCSDGNCSACGQIACDAPWLQPKPVGCGRTHKCNVPWQFALHEDELDEADLPGRPPHTIVCVRAKGKTQSTVVEELMCGPNVVDNDPCNSYDLYLCVYIPVEIIVRDCAGFLYCLTSAMSQIVRIPLTTRVRNLKDTQIYLKARVRLCRTKVVRYPNSGSGDTLNDGIHHPPTAEYDEQDTADNDVRPCGAAGNRWQTTRDSEIATDPPLGLADTNEPGPYDPLNDQRENRPVADDDIARNVGCGKLGYKQSTGEKDGFGSATLPDGHIVTRALPTVYLDVLIEACVMRLVPFGVVGDPSAAVGSTQATFLNP